MALHEIVNSVFVFFGILLGIALAISWAFLPWILVRQLEKGQKTLEGIQKTLEQLRDNHGC